MLVRAHYAANVRISTSSWRRKYGRPHYFGDEAISGSAHHGSVRSRRGGDAGHYGGRSQSALRHRVTTLEGDWHPLKGVVILEFPSYEQALAWYHSPEYVPLRELIMATGRFDVILVDGMSDADPMIGLPHDAWKSERIAELEAEEAKAAQDQPGGAPGSG